MKRVLTLCAAVVILASCQLPNPNAYVRFQNSTDTNFYGAKLGSAGYYSQIPPGFASNYYPTQAGTYSLQLADAGGTWSPITTGLLSVFPGDTYTIFGTGADGNYQWSAVLDSSSN